MCFVLNPSLEHLVIKLLMGCVRQMETVDCRLIDLNILFPFQLPRANSKHINLSAIQANWSTI